MTDTHTDTHTPRDGIDRTCVALHGKNASVCLLLAFHVSALHVAVTAPTCDN